MRTVYRGQIINWVIASVWLINGLYCKVLNLVPRHELIVARILGINHAHILTQIIGLGEIALAVAIIFRVCPRLLAYAQITLVLVMNVIEYTYAQDLLLFGKWNLFFAFCFCLLIYYYNFIRNENPRYA
ncbi:hypothetical protein H8S90_13740 [Olivibacter sp. SDN3]|uniref:DoxX-like family protein n=1 Tax=Olivibacter sp. SDN3 TaxID=2764720 RepID=UPI001651696A|nr:DoxX-like family protein [Olivibacter sp. SDN3]QNL47881.1 hypothetical protein H8S90_13740 [Olivibacter sp. SDN3]